MKCIVIIIWSLAAASMVFTDLVSPFRALVVFSFLLFCPGLSLISLLRLADARRDLLTELTLAIAISLALDMLVALLMLYTGQWSPRLGLALLIFACAIGLALQFVQSLHRANRLKFQDAN
jgi:uncharacterized membrane protein